MAGGHSTPTPLIRFDGGDKMRENKIKIPLAPDAFGPFLGPARIWGSPGAERTSNGWAGIQTGRQAGRRAFGGEIGG